MKKILTVMLAASLVLVMTACGKNKVSDGDAGQSVVQGGAAVDEKGNEITGTAIDGAGAEVDMEKIDGTELKSDSKETSGEIGNYEVSIDDAKMIEAEVEGENKKLVVVSFTFKNNSSKAVAFDNVLKVDAIQNDLALNAKPVSGVEGLNMRSGVEIIDSKKTNRVQKAYVITDEQTPVEISVYKADEDNSASISKTFNLK